MRTVVWSAEAVADLLALARHDHRQAMRINDAVIRYARGERADLKKLSGSAGWRIRVGDWRILLRVEPDASEILRILNRRDAYE